MKYDHIKWLITLTKDHIKRLITLTKDLIKRLITLTSDNIKRLSLYHRNQMRKYYVFLMIISKSSSVPRQVEVDF
jgi:hypothetical protein